MAKFCGKCGALVENGVCPKCGAEYQGTAPFVLYKCREKARNKIKIHIIINCILWICIGALQLFDIYYIRGMFNIEIFKWEKSLVIILIVCILNLLIGNYIGFVLNLHMLYIRHIINKNKMLLISI